MDLLERFTRGEMDAFEELFRGYQGEVFAWIVRIVRDKSTAEELTVETFWRIHKSHARFDPARGEFGAWARRIATNLAIDHLNRERRWSFLPFMMPAATDRDAVEAKDLSRVVRMVLKRLPAKLRTVATLALVEECPHNVIAAALGIPMGTVKSRLFRAVRILRKDLARMGLQP